MAKDQCAKVVEGGKSKSPDKPSPNGRNAKPIVFSSERFDKIKKNASNKEEEARLKQLELEDMRKQKLKKDSEESKKKFVGNMKVTAEQILAKQKRTLEKSDKEAQELFEKTKENEAINRRDRIAKAEELLEKLKPGPRDLCTAALQSEILRARNVQHNLKQEFIKAIQEQECLDKIRCQSQLQPFVEEEKERIVERQQNTNSYKKELLKTINNAARQRTDKHKEQIKEEQASLKLLEEDVQAQITKEKMDMLKKRDAMRKTAADAMRMAEQRRLREQMQDEVEQRMRCVYTVGKRNLDDMRYDQLKKMAKERAATMDANTEHLQAVQANVEAKESERMRRHITREPLKFTEEEHDKVLRDRAAKKARIESYMRDMERLKQSKKLVEEERRFYMAQRFKNSDMNAAFNENAKKERTHKVYELRTQLNAQADEAKRLQQLEKEQAGHDYDPSHYDKEDKYYFNYAHKLITDAYKKDRPLYPFVKTVQQYKRQNYIDCERKQPQHLVSQVGIGCRQPGDSKADDEYAEKLAAAAAAGDGKGADERNHIAKLCAQIDAVVAMAAKDEAAAKEKECAQQCPVDCSDKRPLNAKRTGVDECARKRYSMQELKRINQYICPPQHY